MRAWRWGRASSGRSKNGDGVVIEVGRLLRQPLLKAEQVLEGVVEPEARRGAAKQVVIAGEDAPDLARVFDLLLTDFEVVQRDALAVQHAEDIVVWLDEQGRRVGEWLVGGEPGCLGMSVGADDGQVFYLRVQGSSNLECAGFGWKQAVFMEQHGCNFTSWLRSGAFHPRLRSDQKYTHWDGGREYLQKLKISDRGCGRGDKLILLGVPESWKGGRLVCRGSSTANPIPTAPCRWLTTSVY